MTRWREQSCLARVSIDYIAGQSVVLPGHVEQPGPSLFVGFGLGPFPELRSQLAVVRQAFSLGHTSARRSQIVHRESALRYIGCARLNPESTRAPHLVDDATLAEAGASVFPAAAVGIGFGVHHAAPIAARSVTMTRTTAAHDAAERAAMTRIARPVGSLAKRPKLAAIVIEHGSCPVI